MKHLQWQNISEEEAVRRYNSDPGGHETTPNTTNKATKSNKKK